MVDMLQENRNDLEKAMQTKAGKEPHIVTCLTDSDAVSNNFIVGDGVTVMDTRSVSAAILHLLAVYWMLNLNFPPEYAQLLGLVQLQCLDVDFPPALRSHAFTSLKEALYNMIWNHHIVVD